MKSCRYLRASKTLIRGVSAKEFILSVHQLKETSALLSQLNSGAIWSGYWADVLSVNGNILPPTSHQARYVACCRQKSTSGRRAQHEVGRTNDPFAAKRTRGRRRSGRQRREEESPWSLSLSLSVGAQVKGATNHINESARHEFGFSRPGLALDHRARQSCRTVA